MKRSTAWLAVAALVLACNSGGKSKPRSEPPPQADEPPVRSKVAAVDEADRLGPTVGEVTPTSSTSVHMRTGMFLL
ncbi:MAG: hypothetical protein HKN10_02575 [Myxococcales bacterium]|nr:hypothetical protein [Myxococcales bacterium]